jgi:hypothetical protein
MRKLTLSSLRLLALTILASGCGAAGEAPEDDNPFLGDFHNPTKDDTGCVTEVNAPEVEVTLETGTELQRGYARLPRRRAPGPGRIFLSNFFAKITVQCLPSVPNSKSWDFFEGRQTGTFWLFASKATYQSQSHTKNRVGGILVGDASCIDCCSHALGSI